MNSKISLLLLLGTFLVASLNAQVCLTFHQIRLEDTCFKIAAKYNLSMKDINILNPNLNCNSLRKGQILCVELESLPSETCSKSHIVKQGDTCNYISNLVGTNLDELKSCNPSINLDCTNLFIGQTLLF